MNVKTWSSGGFWLACSGLGLALGGANVAWADNTVDLLVQADTSPIKVVRVAPGSPVHIVSLGRKVSYSDINFNSPTADADLEKRLSDAAVHVCQRLDESFPDSRPRGQTCAELAVKDALRKVHANELAAQRRASN